VITVPVANLSRLYRSPIGFHRHRLPTPNFQLVGLEFESDGLTKDAISEQGVIETKVDGLLTPAKHLDTVGT
jgi:hypothetical protein